MESVDTSRSAIHLGAELSSLKPKKRGLPCIVFSAQTTLIALTLARVYYGRVKAFNLKVVRPRNSGPLCALWLEGHAVHFDDICPNSNSLADWAREPGYALESGLIETFTTRHGAGLGGFAKTRADADVILLANSATSLYNCHLSKGKSHEESLENAVGHIWQLLNKTTVGCNQHVALVFAHDSGRWDGQLLSPDIISLQNSGDYSEKVTWHNTIIMPPFGYVQKDVPGVKSRKREVFFAGAIHWDQVSYSFGLRQRGMKVYANSSVVRMHEGEVQDYDKVLRRVMFCLHLPGWASWSHRLFSIIDAGCIPIFVHECSAMPLELQLNWESASLFISEKQFLAGNLDGIIDGLSNALIQELHVGLLELRSFLYRPSGSAAVGFNDGFAELLHHLICDAHSRRAILCKAG